jgi:ATP synthase protein I
MTTPNPRGNRGDGKRWRAWEDDAGEAAEPPLRRLSREEARALAERDPSVSPWRVVAAQALAGVVCAAIAMVWGGRDAAWSAAYGAAAVVLPNALLARGMTRRAGNAMAAAAGFMFWEMLKIGVSIAMLVIAARVVPHLSWPVLLATMVVGMKVNWLALLWRGR